MQTQQRSTTSATRTTRRWRPDGPVLIAIVVGAIGALVIGAVFVMSDGSDSDATAEALATAELWIERFEAGDADGFLQLMSPDAAFDPAYHDVPYFGGASDTAGSHAVDARLLYAAGGSLDLDCASVDSAVVRCTGMKNSAFNEAPVPLDITFTVEDGSITVLAPDGDDTTRRWDRPLIADYGNWLNETHPADHADLFFSTTMLVGDREQAERHRELVVEWRAGR